MKCFPQKLALKTSPFKISVCADCQKISAIENEDNAVEFNMQYNAITNPEIKNTLFGYATGGGGNAEVIGIESTNNNIHLGVHIPAEKGRGGGGYGYNNGGSGTVILRYRKYNTGINLNNQKNLNFNYIPDTVIYDFTPFNNLADWRVYATSIGATTSFNNFISRL